MTQRDTTIAGTLDPKLVGEALFVVADFSQRIPSGVTIISATCVASVYDGAADPSPASLLDAGAQVGTGADALKVSQLTAEGAGVVGCQYLLTFQANCDDDQSPIVQLILPVVEKRLG